jgi:glycosyltransferase involved in cell wall biosynthesis
MIVSTTLAGNNEDIIGEALLSVRDHVDACIVIDTGGTDATMDMARLALGDQLIVRHFRWCNDFGAARNFALQAAGEVGATWAMTVDTDERLVVAPGFNLREFLRSTTVNTVFARTTDRRYSKERAIRLGAGVHWIGYTHEATNDQTLEEVTELREITFDELEKTEEQKLRNFVRDVPLLRQFIADNPQDARAYFYLGMSFYNRGLYAECIEPFQTSAALYAYQWEGVVAVERLMKSLWQLGRWEEAVQVARQARQARPEAMEFQFYLDIAHAKQRKAAQE